MRAIRFCPSCHAKLVKYTTATGIEFKCSCEFTVQGDAEDTLMYSSNTTEMLKIHMAFIKNAPYDPARLVVLKDCPKCKLNFMTQIFVGQDMTAIYTCTCGFRATHAEYIAKMAETQTAEK